MPVTIGDIIQEYRKNKQMSQEELGQKLLVSRQTISQWEKGQTMPTVDNLVRLKAIFGISVDELLTPGPTQEQKEAPKEMYCVTVTADEVKKIGKQLNRKAIVTMVVELLLMLLAIARYCVNSEESGSILFFAGVFGAFAFVVGFNAWRAYKNWRDNAERIARTTYTYEIFSTYLTVEAFANGEKRAFEKVYLEAIKQMLYVQEYLLMAINGRIYILRKAELKPDSLLHALMQQRAQKKTRPRPTGVWRAVSIVTFIITILCLYGPLVVIALMKPGYMPAQMWVFYLFLPIPMASIAVGYILKKKGYKYKKNVISGIIMAILLCIYGSFTFLF